MSPEQLKSVQNKVKHVIVLMLENRSFDHMLGFSKITGTIARTNQPGSADGINEQDLPFNEDSNHNRIYSSADAPTVLDVTDPGHEFHDVLVQLTNNKDIKYDPVKGIDPASLNNAGFVVDFEMQKKHPPDKTVVMKAFSPGRVPIINQLAKEFVVCDSWFSSLPGPTWPNRLFVHAATSGGLDDSPTVEQIVLRDAISGYHFDNGTIFKSLSEHRLNWAIYAGNKFPQALALKGIRSNDILDYENFATDIRNPGFPAYTFIEPDYGHFLGGNYKGGNSQHPLDDVTSGERLIKKTYETIRNSPVWKNCIFILAYDEHGGFYDHVIPPEAVDPGGTKKYSKHGFNFKRYGIRVPALIISPLIEKNLIDKNVYDHSSIPATIERLFNLPSLTERDKNASDFLDLVTLDCARDTPKQLVEIAEEVINPQAILDSSLTGFVHVAMIRHMEVASPSEREQIPSLLNNLTTREDALRYMKDIKEKIQ